MINNECLTIGDDGFATTGPCTGNPKQIFAYDPAGQIRQNGKCLITDGSTNINGQKLKMGDCRIIGDIGRFHLRDWFTSAKNIDPLELDQSWLIGRPYFEGAFGNKIKIINRLTNKCLAISHGTDINVIIWDCGSIQNNNKYWTVKNSTTSLVNRFTSARDSGRFAGIVKPPVTVEPIVSDVSEQPQIMNLMDHQGILPDYDIQLTSMTTDEINRVKENGEGLVIGPRTKLTGDTWQITNNSFEFDLILNQVPEYNTAKLDQQPIDGPELLDLSMNATTLAPGVVLNNGQQVNHSETLVLGDVILGPYTTWTIGELKFYNPTGMQIEYLFHDTTEKTASQPEIGAPFQSGMIQVFKDCQNKESKTYPSGRYTNTGAIAKLIVLPMTKVIVDGVPFENKSLKQKEWSFCSSVKQPSEVIVEFSSNYVGLGVSRISPSIPSVPSVPAEPVEPVVEGFRNIQFDGYPLAFQGVGPSDVLEEIGQTFTDDYIPIDKYHDTFINNNARTPEDRNNSPGNFYGIPEKMYYSQDKNYDNPPMTYDFSGHDLGSQQSKPLSFNTHSNTWNSVDLESLAYEKVDCQNHYLTGFGISGDKRSIDYKYNCSQESDGLIPFNGNRPFFQRHLLSQEVLLNDLTSLFDLDVDCGGRAILGMQAVVDNGRLFYMYRCGRKPMQQFAEYRTKEVEGRADNIQPLLDLYLQCPEGAVLTAWALNGYYSRTTPHGDVNKYFYTYECALPTNTNRKEANLHEAFGTGTEESENGWLSITIIAIIILILIIVLKKSN